MPRATPFRLNRTGLLCALISTAFAGQAGATAGRVEFAIGPATVVGADGRTRPAGRGTELDAGDLVRTNNGRVQMRMTDGSFISLQPNTEFGIKEYKYEGKTDGSESAFYSLLKGAMRTVTGLIGRVNRNRYQVATPTATVGIRGTGGLIEILNDGATLVQGTSGIWFLANPSGSIDIPAGVSGVAPADPNQPPKETADIPTAGPAPLPPTEEYVQGNQREGDGKNVIAGGILQSGTGYSIVAALRFGSDAFVGDGNADATFNAAGQLVNVAFASETYTLQSGGSHADFGTDGILAWGRWVGPVSVTSTWLEGSTSSEDYGANEGLHYVIGTPTASMPLTGTARYALLGATRPTLTDGSAVPGTFSGNLTVNFDKANPIVGMNLNIAVGTLGYAINGNASISGSTFSGSFFQGEGLSGTTAGSCSCGCSASVNGFFAGATAERAGLAYRINDTKVAIGAAAFAKQ